MERMRGYQESRRVREITNKNPDIRAALDARKERYKEPTEEKRIEKFGEAVEGKEKEIAELADMIVDHLLATYAPEYERPPISDVRIGPNRYHHDSRQVTVERTEDSTYGDALLLKQMVHEKMHEASANTLMHSIGHMRRRSGLFTGTKPAFTNGTERSNESQVFFLGMNEAVVTSFEHEALLFLEEDGPYRKAIQKRNEDFFAILPEEEQNMIRLFPLDIEITVKGDKLIIANTYWRDQLAHARIMKRIQQMTHIDFSAVNHAFKSAAITGDFSIIKKMIQQTFGATGMRVISRWTPIENDETHKIFFDYLSDPNEENAEWAMRAFKTVSCKVCGKESSGLHCVICDSPLYDDVKERYDQPRQH